MNVPADVMVKLAQELGVSGDLKAEGVARVALERLQGSKEYHLEHRHPLQDWVFVAFHKTYAEAQAHRSRLRGHYPTESYRIVELLRRVMP